MTDCRRRIIGIVVVALAVLSVPITCTVGSYLHRPMFFNTFAVGNFGFFPVWHPSGFGSDNSGHPFAIDTELNLIVVVDAASMNHGHDFDFFNDYPNAKVVRWPDSVIATIERQSNAVIIVYPNGNSKRYDMDDGVAEAFSDARYSEPIGDIRVWLQGHGVPVEVEGGK